MAKTYTPIATTTLSSSATSVTFSSISSSYTDLILICSVLHSTADTLYVQYNSDTGSNYSSTYMESNGSGMLSQRQSNVVKGLLGLTQVGMSSTNPSVFFTSINNYSNTTAYKTAITQANLGSAEVESNTHLWRSTSAINTIKVLPSAGNMNSGSTFTLYGIVAA